MINLLESRSLLMIMSYQRHDELIFEHSDPCSGYIIDECSIERNRILVTTALIGGPSERLVPSRQLSTVSSLHVDTRSCYTFNPDLTSLGGAQSAITLLYQQLPLSSTVSRGSPLLFWSIASLKWHAQLSHPPPSPPPCRYSSYSSLSCSCQYVVEESARCSVHVANVL